MITVAHACLDPMDDSIKCDICKHSYHKECRGLSRDVFDVLPDVIDLMGWVCTDCRTVLNSHNGKLHAGIARLTEQLAEVHVSLAFMTRRPASADRTVRAANFRRDL